jgi:hypothetical protein
VFIMVSRSRFSGTNGNSMPMPRSKPSSSTYMKTEKKMMTAQMTEVSMPILASLAVAVQGLAGASSSLPTSAADIGASACAPRPARPAVARCSVEGLRPLAHHAQHVGGAGAEHEEIGDHEQGQRQPERPAPCGETASAVRSTPYTTQGWRPTSVVIQPARMATSRPAPSTARRAGRGAW